jgi:hypothetical protein
MTRRNWIVRTAVVLSAMGLAASAMGADWVPIKRGGETVREIDVAGASRSGSVVSFTARNVMADEDGAPGSAKYMMMRSRVDCAKRTMAHVGMESYDAKMVLISKQNIPPLDAPVAPGSADESVFKLLCDGTKAK